MLGHCFFAGLGGGNFAAVLINQQRQLNRYNNRHIITIETIVAFDCNKLSAALLFFEADVLKVAASSVLEKMILNAEIAELRQMLQRGHERTVILPSVGARHAKFTLPNW